MKMCMTYIIALLLGFTGLTFPVNATPAFDEFKVVYDRNIFDPDRSPQRRYSRPAPRREPSVERVQLRGVITNGSKSVAFFDGSSSEYDVTLKSGDSIAGWEIMSISTEKIRLEREGKSLFLPIGSSLVKEEGEGWELRSESITFDRSDEDSSSSDTSDDSDSDTGGETNDLLKKLMERRQKEISQ